MTLFEEIISELNLLTEEASINDINTAINGLHPVWIKYDDNQGGGGKNRRLICPVAYGITTAGNPAVRAFQPQGSTKRGIPKWKLFRIDRIKFWRTINSNTYKPEDLVGFNEDGDKQMQSIFSIAPIGNAKGVEIKNNKVNIGPNPVSKQDVDNGGAETGSVDANHIINGILQQVSQNPEKNIDNQQQNPDNSIEAPETKPITKQYVEPKLRNRNGQFAKHPYNFASDKRQFDINSAEWNDAYEKAREEVNNKEQMTADSNPILKSDIEGEEDIQNNELTNSYNDMMDRMNRLYKDEEEY